MSQLLEIYVKFKISFLSSTFDSLYQIRHLRLYVNLKRAIKLQPEIFTHKLFMPTANTSFDNGCFQRMLLWGFK